MDSEVSRFVVAFLASLAVVEATLSATYSDVASHVAMVLLSLVVADLGVTALDKLLPRGLLSDLANKAVLITGCDSGLGQECARRLDALGVVVYAGCLFPDREGAAALKASASSRLHIVPLDVTKDDSVQAALQFVKSTIGDKALWAVVNNAGVRGVGELHWLPTEEIQKVIDVNVLGVVRVTKAFLDMVVQAKGRVVCIGSFSGRCTWTPLMAYAMSKHALVAFADGLRRQMRKWSVTVHTIESFFICKTNLTDKDNIRQMIKRDWNSNPSEVRAQYGEEYFNAYVNSVLSFMSYITLSNMTTSVDSMVDATVGASPKITYSSGIFPMWFISLIPNKIMDVVMDLLPPNGCRPAALQRNLEKKQTED